MKTPYLIAIVAATLSVAQIASADDTTTAPPTNAPADSTSKATNGLVLNFHDVPLNAVLTYLSAKAGLIVVSDVSLQGKVSVVAEQPISTNDIVSLLDDQLGKNGYAAVLEGRTLSIMDSDRAKTYALTPVKVAGSYTNIPIDDQIVTEILPLRTLSAPQLLKDLDQLIPRTATVTANEAGNSLIMTGQQKDVRRIDEIVNSLDGSAVSDVEVFALKYADSKAVADELKEVFQSQDSEVTRAQTRNNFRGGRGGGGGAFGAMFGSGGGGGGNSSEGEKNVQSHAVFVSDDQLNAVVASAPPDYMAQIYRVITNIDVPSDEVTQMKVFKLKHADPGEVADEISSLFPSSTSTEQNSRSMGMRFVPPWMQQQSSGNNESPRMKRETTVIVVPDRRIQAVIVTASRDTMEQLEGVIKDLDQGDRGVQIVTAMDFGGADPATVQETLAGLFLSSNSKSQQSSTQNQTPLTSRYQGNANSQSSTAQTAAQNANTALGSGGGAR